MVSSAVRSHATRRGRHRALGAGVALGVVTLVGGSALVSAAPTATVPGAITSVDIAATTSGPFEKVRIDLRFAVPDQAVAGDEFHLALPAQLMAAGPGFEVKDAAGQPIAVASTVGNVVTFTTTAYVDQHDAVVGSAFLEAGWDRRKVTAGDTVELVFDADGSTFRDSVTLSGGLPDRSRPDAWLGWADERAEDSKGPTNALRWVVASPQTLAGSSGTVSVVVTPGAGSSLACDRVTVAESTKLDEFHEFVGQTSVPAARRTITCGAGQIAVDVTGVAASTWVLVVGRATVTDPALGEYTNSATVTANGATATARGLAKHSPAGGNGGGAARPATAGGSTKQPPTAGGSGSARIDSDPTESGSGSAALSAGDGLDTGGVDAAQAGAGSGVGSAIGSGETGEPASIGTSNTGVDADRSNGFQGRALVFLAVVAIGIGFVWRRRRH
ncbi:MAG TPA: Ig-like domain-containing protein [Microthrixaceae bacterium]|nr:Ig-like domain-containing protein [Microthrixaceae bacterium]HQF94264.1 Ig-like domain-containing protein [Microthrixaceae bacterium]